jgi:hypothetical protein
MHGAPLIDDIDWSTRCSASSEPMLRPQRINKPSLKQVQTTHLPGTGHTASYGTPAPLHPPKSNNESTRAGLRTRCPLLLQDQAL